MFEEVMTIEDEIKTHICEQIYICKQTEGERQNRKQTLLHSIDNSYSIFEDINILRQRIQPLTIVSPSLCFLTGCIATSKEDLSQIFEIYYSQHNELLGLKEVEIAILKFYDDLHHPLTHNFLKTSLSNLKESLKHLINFTPFEFAFDIIEKLEMLNNNGGSFLQSIYLMNKPSFENKSILFVLIDTIINIAKLFSTTKITIYIFAPHIRFIVIDTDGKVFPKILVTLPNNILVLKDTSFSTFLHKINYASDDVMQSFNKYKINIEPTGLPYKTFYFGLEIPQVLYPFSLNINLDNLTTNSILYSILLSKIRYDGSFRGIIEETTNTIIPVDEITKTTWYEICEYFWSPHMTILGTNGEKLNIEIIQMSFIEVAAHFFTNCTFAIEKYWMDSNFWKIIPFKPLLFRDITDNDIHTIELPFILVNKPSKTVNVNNKLHMLSVHQHRNLDEEQYSLMCFAQCNAIIRSYVLSENISHRSLCPFMNKNFLCILPLDPAFQEPKDQEKYIQKCILEHGQSAKDEYRKMYQIFFPS